MRYTIPKTPNNQKNSSIHPLYIITNTKNNGNKTSSFTPVLFLRVRKNSNPNKSPNTTPAILPITNIFQLTDIHNKIPIKKRNDITKNFKRYVYLSPIYATTQLPKLISKKPIICITKSTPCTPKEKSRINIFPHTKLIQSVWMLSVSWYWVRYLRKYDNTIPHILAHTV